MDQNALNRIIDSKLAFDATVEGVIEVESEQRWRSTTNDERRARLVTEGAIHSTGDPEHPYARDIRKMPKRPKIMDAKTRAYYGISEAETMMDMGTAIETYKAEDNGKQYPLSDGEMAISELRSKVTVTETNHMGIVDSEQAAEFMNKARAADK